MKPRLDKKEKIRVVTGIPDAASGLEIIEYCKQNNVSVSSFHRWKKRFKRLIESKTLSRFINQGESAGTDRAPRVGKPIKHLMRIRQLEEENKVLKDKLLELILKS